MSIPKNIKNQCKNSNRAEFDTVKDSKLVELDHVRNRYFNILRFQYIKN